MMSKTEKIAYESRQAKADNMLLVIYIVKGHLLKAEQKNPVKFFHLAILSGTKIHANGL